MSSEEGHYLPASDFLVSVMNEEVVFDDSEFGQANLRLLIAMTKDADRSNRDWAAMLLGHNGPVTREVRDALVVAADDPDQYVRGEAIHQLVDRDAATALQLVRRELAADNVCIAIFNAAEELADPSLVEPLRRFQEPSGDSFVDQCAIDALKACEGRTQI